MLYLEDYLEMIEHLPQELRDRFTEMRELDLTVQNSMDSLEKKTRTFFQQCKRGELQNEASETEFQTLRKEYYKVLEDADEKVVIATQIHELVERYLRRLDSELFKFKCELEADNNGITEILEKRSLEMDGGSSAATALLNVIGINQKENRYYGSVAATASSNSHSAHNISGNASNASLGNVTLPAMPTSAIKDNRYRPNKIEKRRDSNVTTVVPEKRPNLGNNITTSAPLSVAVVCPIKPGISGTHSSVLNPAAAATVASPNTVAYNLQQLGGGGAASNAIAAAASQAIVATQQMQQGRRTASLKASYEAIHGAGGGPTEFWISRDIANAATAATQSTIQGTPSEKKQKKKLNTSHTHSTASTSGAILPSALSVASSSSSLSVDSVDMLPSVATINNVVGVSSLGLPNVTSSNVGLPSSTANTAASLTPNTNLSLNDNGFVVEQTPDGEWSYDPNEPRYCTCNQVSYGDMVACDNEACPYEWFHYPCVGITQPPKGKWYCPKCTASMRRRNRKN